MKKIACVVLGMLLLGFTHRSNSYYWYDESDSYVDYNTVSSEITTLEDELDVLVDQNSVGGTAIESGYVNNADPHNYPPAVILYAHY